MANYEPAFEKMIHNEGGYTLHKVQGDRGGLTYAGITEKFYPDWEGWDLVKHDPNNPKITGMVRAFYKKHYWDRILGDQIQSQNTAESIFDFGVNAGVGTSAKLAQLVVGASPDGIIGERTIAKINEYDEKLFVANFALSKVARYASIVNKDRSQAKFLLGWINRTLEGLK